METVRFPNTGGSAEVMEALGVRFAMSPEDAARAVREIGIGFLFAPNLHPAMKYAQPVRRELKMRTVFNLLGPLVNPARAQTQLIGAPSRGAARIMAEALAVWVRDIPLSSMAMMAWMKSAPAGAPTFTTSARGA